MYLWQALQSHEGRERVAASCPVVRRRPVGVTCCRPLEPTRKVRSTSGTIQYISNRPSPLLLTSALLAIISGYSQRVSNTPPSQTRQRGVIAESSVMHPISSTGRGQDRPSVLGFHTMGSRDCYYCPPHYLTRCVISYCGSIFPHIFPKVQRALCAKEHMYD